MFQKTPQKQVLFPRTLAKGLVGGFLACLFLFGLLYSVLATPKAEAANVTASTINFQARLETKTGAIVPDGYYNVEFKLYDGDTAGGPAGQGAGYAGTNLWTEDWYDSNGVSAGNDNRVQVRNGYLTVSLGSQNPFPSTINWDQGLWITLNIGGTTQTATPTYDGEMNPRLQLTSVPYAFRAGQLAQFNSSTGFTSTLSILQPTVGSQTFQIADQANAGTYTLCVHGATAAKGGCAPTTGGSGYIQNQNGSAQTSGDFWINGSGRADTSLLTPALDSATISALSVGGTNANAITIGNTTNTATTTIIATTTLNLGNNANNKTINIGATGSTANTTTINIATSSGAAQAVTVGSTASSSTSTVQASSSSITLNNAGIGVNTSTINQSLTLQGALGTAQLPVPSFSGVSVVGASGTAAYSYRITATDGTGEAANSSTGSPTSPPNTLDGSNYIHLTWNRVPGAISYKIYRVSSTGTPSTTGLIGTVSASAATMAFDDTGLAASGTIPSTNTTGGASIAGILTVGSTITLQETTAPSATSGFGKLYVSSSDHKLRYLDYSGTDIAVGSGGGGSYVTLQGSTPGTPDTGNLNISGTGIFGTALQAPSLDTASAGTLTIGNTNATTINIGTVSAARTINLGNANASTTIQLQAATGTYALNTSGVSVFTQTSTSNNIATFTNSGNTRTTTINQWGDINVDPSSAIYTNNLKGYSNTDLNIYAQGTGNITLQTYDASSGVLVKTNTNSTTAFQVQNASNAAALSVDTTVGATTLQATTTSSDAAAVGSELVTSQDFTNVTYWSCSGWTTTTTTAQHNTGNITACSATASNFTVTAGTTYQVSYRLAGNSTATDTVQVSIGGASTAAVGQTGTNTQWAVITATGTGALTFTPTTNFNGTISSISVKVVTLATSTLTVKSSGGATKLEVRSSSTNGTFIGYGSGSSNTSGSNNTGVGYGSLQGNTSGSYNAAFGTFSLQSNTTASYNTGFGYGSLKANTTGTNNTASGYLALSNNTTGSQNSAVGGNALSANTTGLQNTALGWSSLFRNTTGSQNTAVGLVSLTYNTTGSYNTALGYSSLYSSTTGINNTATGVYALGSNTTGSYNTATGYYSLRQLTTQNGTITATANNGGKAQFTTSLATYLAAGLPITVSGTTSYNGAQTIFSVDSSTTFTISASYSTADASGAWTTGDPTGNTAFGSNAGYGANQYYAAGNSLFGYNAGTALQSGASYNTIMGYNAGSTLSTGTQNLLLGYNAGANLTIGANNIILGAGINAPSATASYQLDIGNTLYGDMTSGQQNLAVGVNAFNGKLTVGGSIALQEISLPSGTTGYGKLYVSSGDHKLHFVDNTGADTTLGSGGGGGSHVKAVTMVPEYAGAVFSPSGTNNSGYMSSNYVHGLAAAQGYHHNYYDWTTDQATAQNYDIVLQYQIPSDFSSFVAGSWKLWTYVDSLTSTAISWDIRSASDGDCYASTQSAKPASATTWTQISLSDPGNGCTFAAGDTITIDVNATAISPSTNQVRVGEFTYQYNTAY